MSRMTNRAKQEALSENEEKWTSALLDEGWVVLPNIILERQQALGLDATDINILLHLARHWWFKDRLPYPTKKTIAECMGVHPSTVQRHIAEMEKGGLIKRIGRFDKKHGGQQANKYSFQGLIKEATPFANEKRKTKEARKKEDAESRTRKRLQK